MLAPSPYPATGRKCQDVLPRQSVVWITAMCSWKTKQRSPTGEGARHCWAHTLSGQQPSVCSTTSAPAVPAAKLGAATSAALQCASPAWLPGRPLACLGFFLGSHL